jgi:DNA-binding winged helix-turn-helix (wHTH) protein
MDINLEEAPLLIGQTGPLKGERWTLNKTLTIGRELSCDVVIPDRQVSHIHARVTPTNEGIILEDLGSKNGVHCNGNLVVGKITLQDGDVVQIALAQQFLFLTSDATIPLSDIENATGRLRMDQRSRSVWVNNQVIDPPLSALQFHVLEVLSEHKGQVVDRQQLVGEVWGEVEAVGVSDQALDALLRRLRERIAAIDPEQSYIVTIRGHGIRLDNPSITK